VTISIVDVKNFPELPHGTGKKLFFDSPGFHVWIHAGDAPGEKTPMHKHTADQTFYCVSGEATYNFPDRPSEKLRPGMMIIIPKGDFYQIENSGPDYLCLLGTRAETYKKPRFNPKDEELKFGKPKILPNGEVISGRSG
jgi:mannose-6-phosphate isomerase-like protein (cupin superfamily)